MSSKVKAIDSVGCKIIHPILGKGIVTDVTPGGDWSYYFSGFCDPPKSPEVVVDFMCGYRKKYELSGFLGGYDFGQKFCGSEIYPSLYHADTHIEVVEYDELTKDIKSQMVGFGHFVSTYKPWIINENVLHPIFGIGKINRIETEDTIHAVFFENEVYRVDIKFNRGGYEMDKYSHVDLTKIYPSVYHEGTRIEIECSTYDREMFFIK